MSTLLAPQIGYWWAECCIHDLSLIETQEDLQDVSERISPDEIAEIGPPRGIWTTLRAALDDLEPELVNDEMGQGISWALRRYVLKDTAGWNPARLPNST